MSDVTRTDTESTPIEPPGDIGAANGKSGRPNRAVRAINIWAREYAGLGSALGTERIFSCHLKRIPVGFSKFLDVNPLMPLDLTRPIGAPFAAMWAFPGESHHACIGNFRRRWRFANDRAAIASFAIDDKIPSVPLNNGQRHFTTSPSRWADIRVFRALDQERLAAWIPIARAGQIRLTEGFA